jgi:hypothetical protein
MDIENFYWIRNSFEAIVIAPTITAMEEKQIIDISSDTALRIKFTTLSSLLSLVSVCKMCTKF